MLHGGQLQEAKRQYPHVLQSWIDLSTGINPYAYPFTPIPTGYLTQLPSVDDEYHLRKLVALRYGIHNPNLIAVAPGTQILISLLPYILKAKQVCVLGPTYMEHVYSWQQAGIPLYQVASLDEFMVFSEQEQTIGIICNPNNPDGRLFTVQEMQEIACQWGKTCNHLVVDEAFMDFEGQSIAAFLPISNLTILRSFGKTYGLAGIRLGFLLSNAYIVEKVRTMLGPWAINGSALHIGLQTFQDKEWFLQTKNKLLKQIELFDRLFPKNDCKIVGGTYLFRLVEMGKSQELWKYLANHGVWVRRFDYNSTWLRFGLPKEREWERVEKVIKDYFKLTDFAEK